MAGCDWYSTKEALETIQEFHQKYARQPKEMEEAKERHVVIMNDLENYLRDKNLLSRLEFTGSAYEGLKVGGKELEFDVMFVLKDGQHLKIEKEPTANRYGHLKPKSQDASDRFKSVTDRGEVLPFRVRDKFHGEVQKWVNKRESGNPELKDEIKLKYSGPAIRAIVHKNGKEWYNVDLVPAYEVLNGAKKEMYVAKPRGNDDTMWRHSLSVEEKTRLMNIDGPDNGCRKKIVRILKVVRDNEPGLDKMISFYIKNKIIQMTDQRKPPLDWSEKNLALRLKDVMTGMAKSFDKGVLSHPFCCSVNILQDLNPVVGKNISSRLGRIATSEKIAKEKFKS